VIVLASTAKHRAALLARLRLPFETARPDFDEETASTEGAPADVARRFAEGKARSVRRPAALVVGADQTAEIDGESLAKPLTLDAVAAQLRRLAGRTHTLHSAVAVYDVDADRVEVDVADVELTMRPLTEAQIAAYLAVDHPVGSVGGYLYEGVGVALFDEVRGADDSAIVGLPLVVTARLLRRFGVDPLSR
jgi:septum formation protein